MAFDFFNDGLTKESTAEFTKAENEFLQSKLVLLDPKRTGRISLALTLNFLKFSNLRSPDINKIMKNCKKDSQSQLSYDDMKRIFRGVGLVQHGIEPTLVNINANIPNKAPKFYDDDDESDQEESPPQKLPPSPPPPKQPSPPTQHPAPAREATMRNQPPLPIPTQQQPTPQKPDPNQKLRDFEAQWARLHTKNNSIDGAQVKHLCKNLAQRSNLSKAWKLCCKTHSGSLTKGQFFVFLQIVGSHRLPEALSPEMKAAIAHIDNEKAKPTKDHSHQPVRNPSQMATSQLFENFGKSETTVTAPPVSSSPKLTGDSSKLLQKVEAGRSSLVTQSRANEEEIVYLRRGQQTMNNMLGEVEQFIGMVSGRNEEVKKQIDELKSNQATLNERLNRVVMAMNNVVVRQNSFIEDLMGQMAQRNAADQQKIAALEQALAGSMQQHLVRQQQYAQMKQQGGKQTQNQHVQSPSTVAQPVPSPRAVPSSSPAHQEAPQRQTQQEQPPAPSPRPSEEVKQSEAPAQHHQKKLQYKAHPQSSRSQQPQHNAEQPSDPPLSPAAPEQLSPEKVEAQKRIKLKQMRLIQLIHHMNPIAPEEYHQVLQKVASYSEQNLDVAISYLYEKYQQQQAAKGGQDQSHPPQQSAQGGGQNDDFSSSNFGAGTDPNNGGDFFA